MEEAIIAIGVELGSAAFKEIGDALGVTKQLEELKETLESINYTLLAPEADRVQIWFNRLQGVYYDAKEILDDFEFYHLQWQGSAGAKARQLLSFSNNPFVFRSVMGRKIKRIRESLSRIKMDKDACDTVKGGGGKGVLLAGNTISETFPSFCKSSDVIGRDKEAHSILEFLSEDSDSVSVSAFPIFGIGGIGKTALAFKVYSHEAIVVKFHLKLWVSVKEDFKNPKNLLRKILASASKYSKRLNTEQLQSQLKETLKGKSFLLVLDDVRSVDQVKWDEFSRLLSDGASRGKIVVTTRNQSIATVVNPKRTCELKGLTLENSRALFVQTIGGGDERNSESLMKIGEEIFKKCEGVAGAIRTVTRLLQGNRDEHQWLNVLNNNNDFWRIFEKKDRFLNYEELPFYLKQCFAYFSNLPKHFEILGIELIHQWIAQGFIQPSVETQEPEKVGQDYICELISRSFLQDTDGYGLFSTIKMHDLVHQLAISVAQTEYLIVDSPKKDVPENVRHLLFSGTEILQKDAVPSPLLKKRKLRTVGFQFVGPDRCLLDTCISRFKCLRMLGLRRSSFKALPSSIGDLKYLRYLDLSGNGEMKSLPHSICRLLLLETLMLQGCVKFVKLPKAVGKLPRLRCLRLTTRERFLSGKLIAGLEKLQCLWIDGCGELEHLFDTEEIRNQHILSTVSVLVIMNCKNLLSLPDGMSYFAKLEEFRISECPELIRRCQREEGADWHKISHVRDIYLDGTNVRDSINE